MNNHVFLDILYICINVCVCVYARISNKFKTNDEECTSCLQKTILQDDEESPLIYF